MPRLFLTGGRGMVGRNVQEHPLAAAWDVIAPTSAELDLTDPAAVAAFYADTKPDMVIHAAGRVGGIQANMAHPVAFLDENTMLGRNVIMGAYQAGVASFINLASTCMYPRAAPNPLAEDTILTGELEPTNEGYALAKIMATRLCRYIRQQDPNMQYKTLIPCNLYGPHDKFDPKNSHLLPAIIHKIHQAKINGEPTAEVWGDGTARREFMFAPDLAEVVLKAASDITSLPDLMNTGLGHDYAINDYYQTVADIVGWDGTFTHDLDRPVGMKKKLSDVTRATNWGWTAPTILTDGIAATYDFYLNEVSA
jgi:GDP-L-fucose synthase